MSNEKTHKITEIQLHIKNVGSHYRLRRCKNSWEQLFEYLNRIVQLPTTSQLSKQYYNQFDFYSLSFCVCVWERDFRKLPNAKQFCLLKYCRACEYCSLLTSSLSLATYNSSFFSGSFFCSLSFCVRSFFGNFIRIPCGRQYKCSCHKQNCPKLFDIPKTTDQHTHTHRQRKR